MNSTFLAGEDAEQIQRAWDVYLQQTSYVDPNWVGPLGRMARLNLVGHKHIQPPPPEALDGAIEVRPEPENQHDPNAIAVLFKGKRIAYVRKVQTCLLHTHWQQLGKEGGPTLISTTDPAHLYLIDLPEEA